MRVKYGYWKIQENRKIAASKCSTRTEFKKKFSKAYDYSSKEDLKNYFGESLSLEKKYIYSYEFLNKTIYIGLTSDLKGRHWDHLNDKGTVFDYIQETKEVPIYTILTNNPIDSKNAGELEDFIIEEYRSLGYNILNKVKGGALGSTTRKWTKEEALKITIKYNSLKDFRKDNPNLLSILYRKSWFNEIITHMIQPRKLTYEYCKSQFLLHKNITELRKKDESVYNKCIKNKWLIDGKFK